MIEEVEMLAKLSLTPEEKKEAEKEINQLLSYIDKLNELDTEGIEPMSHVFPLQNVFREDEVKPFSGSREELLKNAPEQREGSFVTPRTVG